ncbi:MAG: hypothetical protein K6V97_04610 [Actinomycetia bacterium]|nr:hypothetical protein [Actinomycetes bacterium]
MATPGKLADFCTGPWGQVIASELEAHPGFQASAAWFDGTIRLAADGRSVTFRIYRGRVIEVAERNPFGHTFSIAADDATWEAILSSRRNRFVAWAMQDRVRVEGNVLEYLRVFKAVMALVDVAREWYRQGRSEAGGA